MSSGKGLASVLSLFLISVPAAVSAQGSGSLLLSATVLTGITITPSGGSDGAGNLNFGAVMPNMTVSIDARSSHAGLFSVDGNAASLLSITYTSPSLTLYDGFGDNLSFVPQIVGDQVETSQSSASVVASGSQVTLSGTGKYFIWFGGSVFVPNSQPNGAYSGIFSMTVSY